MTDGTGSALTENEQPKSYARFGEMTWPLPGERLAEIEWRLRYAHDLSAEERLVAASVISAYAALVNAPETKRRYVVRELRKAQKVKGLP